MPDFNDIAQVRVDSGRETVARMPISVAAPASHSFVFSYAEAGITRRQGAQTAADIWEAWAPAAITSKASGDLSLPFLFNDDGAVVDATDEIKAIADGTERRLRLTLPEAVPDQVLVVTVNVEGGSGSATDRAFFALEGSDATARAGDYSDNHQAAWDAGGFLQGQPVQVDVWNATANAFQDFLPKRPVLENRPIWVRRDDVLGDFNTLAITGEDVLESVATKSVTLTAAYDPLLEDLDTQVVYGTDANGEAIIWRIASTARQERFIQLNLATQVV
ncbi:MAG: hypothetical protein OXP75_01115 [Rhodospirillales bacterium]|nr:hypothetical protein [Rhodospirillales bacterium]